MCVESDLKKIIVRMWNSTGMSGPWTQWNAFQQGAYQDYSHDQVDWGAMALQWIQMKEMQEQVIPPSSGNPLSNHLSPIEMNARSPTPSKQCLDGSSKDSFGWNYLQPWNIGPCFGPPQQTNIPSNIDQIIPQESEIPLKSAMTANSPLAGSYDIITSSPPVLPGITQSFEYNHGNEVTKNFSNFWEGIGPPPAPFLRRNLKEKVVRDKLRKEIESDKSEDEQEISIDATKRRHLPAWIREGLEKMERERQRKEERERMMRQNEEKKSMIRSTMNMFSSSENGSEQIVIPRSKFDSDSDDEDSKPSPTSKKRSRFDEQPSSPDPPEETHFTVYRSQEEILQDTIIKVRRVLTEILLEVTTEEILSVAREALGLSKPKASAQRVQKSGALSSLTGARGLVSYGSGSEGSSSDSDDAAEDEDEDASDEDIPSGRLRPDKNVDAVSAGTSLLSDEEKRRGGRQSGSRHNDSKDGFDKSLDGQVVKHKVVSGNVTGGDLSKQSPPSLVGRKSPPSQKSPSSGRERNKVSRSEGSLQPDANNLSRDSKSRSDSIGDGKRPAETKRDNRRDDSARQSRHHRHSYKPSHRSSSRSRSGSQSRDRRSSGARDHVSRSGGMKSRRYDDQNSRRGDARAHWGQDRRRHHERSAPGVGHGHRRRSSRGDSTAQSRSRSRSRTPKGRQRKRRSRSSSSSSSSSSTSSSSGHRHKSSNKSLRRN